MVVAWQFAVEELADLQKNGDPSLKSQTIEVVDSDSQGSLFI